jgi:hypothetical protein
MKKKIFATAALLVFGPAMTAFDLQAMRPAPKREAARAAPRGQVRPTRPNEQDPVLRRALDESIRDAEQKERSQAKKLDELKRKFAKYPEFLELLNALPKDAQYSLANDPGAQQQYLEEYGRKVRAGGAPEGALRQGPRDDDMEAAIAANLAEVEASRREKERSGQAPTGRAEAPTDRRA